MSNQSAFVLTVTGPHLQGLIKRRIGEIETAVAAERAEEEAERQSSRRGAIQMREIGHRTSHQLASHIKALTMIHDLIDHEASWAEAKAPTKTYQLTLTDLARLDLVDIVERMPI